jgi:2-dehydro-3-deoxyphosphogluconate aldolase/(4S)-4-hydroxy-2-oxoglutarate aldolase
MVFSQAEELGCEIVKVFPGAQVGGPEFVKAVRGPCPWTSIMPTGGVENSETSLQVWFQAGVACVGMGSNLLKKELIEAQRFDELAKTIRNTLDLIKTIRGTQK